MTQTASRIDVRTIAPRDRHPLIFSTFGKLARGQALELVNDHDPRPLYFQFDAQMPGQFEWQYLEQGPDLWRVAITRTATAHESGSCCGSCGGA
ncbi:MAG: DUF2249 domain-containing protein [Comamonadaceae bacterium]|nr:MAG: DUF2249 domain-containing protein [Comamonadaceae bacterium]